MARSVLLACAVLACTALCEAYTSKVMCQKHPLPAALSMDGDCDCKGAQNGANYTCTKMTTFEEGYVVIDEYEKCMSTLTGIVLPGVYAYPKWVQTTLYLLALLYCFLGVAVVADLFMEAIEKITSKTKEIETSDVMNHQQITVTVQFWNPTVANLTLLALGSSAPEIMLATIETITGLGEKPGELGASTIVGSAAFNLLAITAVCLWVVPDGEERRVTQVNVFICTSIWSLVAYFWMVVVLDVISPDRVELWEALVTFFMMPAMVAMAFYIDKWESAASELADGEGTGLKASSNWVGGAGAGHQNIRGATVQSADGDGMIADRKKITEMLRTMEEAGSSIATESVAAELVKSLPPPPMTRHQARTNAVKSMTGQKHYASQAENAHSRERRTSIRQVYPEPEDFSEDMVRSKALAGELDSTMMRSKDMSVKSAKELAANVGILFDTTTMICRESQGDVILNVQLTHKSADPITVDFKTHEGTAMFNTDFIPTSGTLTFAPGTTEQQVSVTLIDDDEFEPDETFTVHLSNAKGGMLIAPAQVLCVIIDDHEPGQIGFEKRFYNVKETDQFATIPVCRTYGAAGRVTIDYCTSDGVATSGKDYMKTSGTLVFEDGETMKEVKVPIILDDEPDNHENFCLSLTKPTGGASMNKTNMAVITILDDSDIDAVAHTVAVLLRQRISTLQPQSRPYRQQFIDALQLQGTVDDMGQEESPSNMMAILHFATIFWKVLFATVPPTDYCGGWATFVASLAYIGLLTAVVGDLATQFGCALGMKDLVTAISFVALGTSLPDMFASKAAITEGTDADAAVGNVTGSNSVNVFLGLGMPWIIGAVYYSSRSENFCVPAGALSFSVLVFSAFAVITLAMLAVRRKTVGAELGGSKSSRRILACFFVSLWMVYVAVSSLQAYDMLGITVRERSKCETTGTYPAY